MSVFLKLTIFIATFLLVQTILYFGLEIFEGEPHDVERPVDRRIPVKPKFAYIYATWFILIVVCPYVFFYTCPRIFMIYMAAMAADIIISITCYMIYPTSFTRPPTESWELKIVYFMSFKQINCAPSMHCSMSYIAAAAAVLCPGIPVWAALLIVLDGIMIPVSTLFTKQHVVIDVLTALPVALVSWIAGKLLYDSGLLENIFSFLM